MVTGENEDGLLHGAARTDAESIPIARQHADRQPETSPWDPTNLLNLTHDSMIVRGMDGRIKYWNRAAEELTGWTAQEAVGRVIYDLAKSVFPVPLDQIEAEVLRTGRWEGEILYTRKDGSQVVVASRWALQRDENGAPVAILSSNNDITERKRAEQAREEIEEQWRAAFESNPTMYFIVDAEGAIASVNTFGAEKLGYSVGELLGQPVLNVFYGPDREFVQSRAEACFEQPGQTVRWEARKIRRDGTMLWVRETANAVVLKQRPVLLVVCEDITEQKRAEEAASRSEKELRDVIETIPGMAWTSLPNGFNIFANARWTEYTGLSGQDTTGLGWQAAVHSEDLARHVEKWRASLASGKPFENEVRFRRVADGEYRWFLARSVPLRDEQGQILKWYGILTDIEDRKRTEALLAGERRILEMVAKGDALPRILDSLCQLVEEQARDVLASILLIEDGRLKHGGAPSLPKAYVEAIDGVAIGPSVGSCGTAAYLAKQVIVSDIVSDSLWDDYRAAALPHSLRACWSTPIISSDAKVIGTFAMYYREPRSPSLRDQEIIEQITHLAGIAIQRKLIEEKLRRSEAYLTEGQRLTHTGSWARDSTATKILYCSEELLRIYEFDPQDGVPPFEAFRQRIHPDDRENFLVRVTEAINKKTNFIDDFRILLPDGTVKHLGATSHPLFDAKGEIAEWVGITADITERKRAEHERERLRQLEADLARVNRVTTMGELTASLAHELNQPIAAAINDANACLRWLARDPADLAEAREAATSVVADGTRAAEIIDRVRSLYQKGSPIQHAPFDMNQVVREMLVLLRDEADRRSIAMRTDLAALPRVAGDRVQLQQVCMNLMLNGIEAMKDTTGELVVRSQLSNDDAVLISVHDTGVGLPAGDADQLFKAFFTTKPQGIGMGLAISRSIIESHGGRLWASPNTPRGAAFHFTLPAAESAS